MTDDDFDSEGNPKPRDTRYPKGVSGNRAGRPPGRKKDLPYPALLDEKVMIRLDGIDQEVTYAEAFVALHTKRALERGGASARDCIAGIEDAQSSGILSHNTQPLVLVLHYVSPGCLNNAMILLKMAVRHDIRRPTARMRLEPWVIEEALSRFGDRRLSVEEQQIVVDATRTPKKVKWLEWWTVLPE